MNVSGPIRIVLRLCLSLLLAIPFLPLARADASAQAAKWDPRNTQVFIVSMVKFLGGHQGYWGEEGRLDFAWVNLLKSRGVAESDIVFLRDDQAYTSDVLREFDKLLSKSRPGETLIFYFSSDGGYNPGTGEFKFSTYDGQVPFYWAFDTMDSKFKGAQVLMFADCCYSGGIVELAKQRRTQVSYACLSSTYCHNLGHSGWRFVDCLVRGFGGSPEVDLDGDGKVTWDELCRFAQKHMSFVADGMPMFVSTSSTIPGMVLSVTTGAKKGPPVGDYVEAFDKGAWYEKGAWYKSEILDAKPGRLLVHHTDQKSTYTNWIGADQVRPYAFKRYPNGANVQVLAEIDQKWHPATVLESKNNMHLCHYTGYSPAYDEWFPPDRMKDAPETVAPGGAANWTGAWKGSWKNNMQETGPDSLVLTEDRSGRITGTWTDKVLVTGVRVDARTVHLSGRTVNRTYDITGSLLDGVMTMTYTARRPDGSTYQGVSTFSRSK